MALTRLPSFTLLSTDSYTFGNANVTGNLSAGNLKTDNLLYANGDPYVFTTDASGSNTQIQFNDANSFAGSANLTFDKTSKTLTVDNIKTDYLFHANGTAWSFATEAQGNLADSAVQPEDLANVATSGNYADLTNKPTLGTAAATDATAYATAAQGTKADTALQAANLTGYATELYVGNAIANLIDSAPGALDTLNELANALGDDANFAGNLTNTLANKLDSSAFTYANITGAPTLGNIVTINLDGNTSNILYGNGVFSSAPVTYGDSNVEAYLPTYAGNLEPGNIIIGVSNLILSGGNANFVLSTDGTGNLSWVAQSTGSAGTLTTIDSFTGDGANATFTLSTEPTDANYTIAVVHGMVQPKSAYTVTGNAITFSSAPASTAIIEVTTLASASGGAGASALTIKDEGSNISTAATSINFVGNGVTATNSSNAITVTVPGISNTSIRAQAMTMGIIFGG